MSKGIEIWNKIKRQELEVSRNIIANIASFNFRSMIERSLDKLNEELRPLGFHADCTVKLSLEKIKGNKDAI